MRILFVRHGHPDYANDCLTGLGHRHAEAAAQRLQHEGIQQIYSSTCGRAYETAGYTARLLGLPVVPCDFMREIRWGSEDGREIPADGHPWTLSDQIVHRGQSVLAADWTQAEGFCGNRVVACVQHIASELDALLSQLGYARDGLYYRAVGDTDQTIAIFSHGGSSSAMLSHLFNLPFPFVCSTMGPDYTAVTVVNLSNEKGKLISPYFELLNDARHIHALRADVIFGN